MRLDGSSHKYFSKHYIDMTADALIPFVALKLAAS